MCVAVPCRVLEVDGRVGRAEIGGAEVAVRFDLLEEVQVGDYVLVHAGFALERVDEEYARETLELLAEAGRL
jgi:hydrogenase expression/formation protein HypC